MTNEGLSPEATQRADEFRTMPDEAREAGKERDRQMAKDLGLRQPYMAPWMFGTCPGGAEYGHGLSHTSVPVSCCARWDAEREARATVHERAAWAAKEQREIGK